MTATWLSVKTRGSVAPKPFERAETTEWRALSTHAATLQACEQALLKVTSWALSSEPEYPESPEKSAAVQEHTEDRGRSHHPFACAHRENTLYSFKKRSTPHFFLMNMAGPLANQHHQLREDSPMIPFNHPSNSWNLIARHRRKVFLLFQTISDAFLEKFWPFGRLRLHKQRSVETLKWIDV